ncbi:MAG: hypothetical protein J6A88_00920 [Oscillospiraceae bacterium]|nr:hypothetical protein [Oscillospiraceae bacterium]
MERLPNFSAEQIKKVAESDAGKQLFALLQQTQAEQLKVAMDRAAAGDYSMAKQTLTSMMNNPQAMALLKQLRSNQDG